MEQDKKLELIREQAAAKIHWGEDPDDVIRWLTSEKRLSGDAAEEIVDYALEARSKEIKKRTLVRIGILSVIFLAVVAYEIVRIIEGFTPSIMGSLTTLVLVAMLIFHFVRYLKGDRSGSVEGSYL